MNPLFTDYPIKQKLKSEKYVFVSGNQFKVDASFKDDIDQVLADFDHLVPDKYLKDGKSFRYRRYGFFYFNPITKELLYSPGKPYFQDSATNSYAGGINRKFASLEQNIAKNKFLEAVTKHNFSCLPLNEQQLKQIWRVDYHQVRVVAKSDELGQPSPEGIHHDGHDFVTVVMMQRNNVEGGISTIYTNEKEPIASTCMQNFMDTLICLDDQVMHGVSPISIKENGKIAHRDVMLISYTLLPDTTWEEAVKEAKFQKEMTLTA